MVKIVCFSLVGVMFFVAGMFEIVRYFLYSQGEYSYVHFILGIVLILGGTGVFILTRSAILKRVAEREKADSDAEVVVVPSNNILDKNNEMISDWEKTNEARDKLKILQISGSTEEEG